MREIMVPEPEWAFWMDDGNRAAPPAPCWATSSMRGASSATSPRTCSASSPAPRWRPASSSIAGLRPHAGPHRLLRSIRQASLLVLSDTVRNPETVRAPSGLAANVRHGRHAGGDDAQENARPRRRRPHAGAGLSFPLPGLRPHRRERERLRLRARRCGGRMRMPAREPVGATSSTAWRRRPPAHKPSWPSRRPSPAPRPGICWRSP